MFSNDDGVIASRRRMLWAGSHPHRPYMVGLMHFVADSKDIPDRKHIEKHWVSAAIIKILLSLLTFYFVEFGGYSRMGFGCHIHIRNWLSWCQAFSLSDNLDAGKAIIWIRWYAKKISITSVPLALLWRDHLAYRYRSMLFNEQMKYAINK